MQTLKNLDHQQLLNVFEDAHLSLNDHDPIMKRIHEGDAFNILIMSSPVIGFTIQVVEGKITWKMGTEDHHPSIIWKEMKHYLEWLEGKRGIMKLIFIRMVKYQGSVPGWASLMTVPLREYIQAKFPSDQKQS